MNFDGVIFDLDGVITDTARLHYEAWNRMAEKYGMDFSEEVNEHLKGVSRMASLEIILAHNHITDFSTEKKEALCREKNDIYVGLLETVTPADILPGISGFLDSLRAAGFRIALASASRNAPAILRKLGITDKFDYMADAGKVSKPKPDPEIFTVCAENLGLDPKRCIGVEDSAAGTEAIKKAGMTAIGINVRNITLAPDVNLKSTSELTMGVIQDLSR